MDIHKLKSNEPIEPFKPRKPDWMQLYYALSLRVVTAQVSLELGNKKAASEALDKATYIIHANERAIEIGNSMVVIKTENLQVA
jgi:hypothetical protein